MHLVIRSCREVMWSVWTADEAAFRNRVSRLGCGSAEEAHGLAQFAYQCVAENAPGKSAALRWRCSNEHPAIQGGVQLVGRWLDGEAISLEQLQEAYSGRTPREADTLAKDMVGRGARLSGPASRRLRQPRLRPFWSRPGSLRRRGCCRRLALPRSIPRATQALGPPTMRLRFQIRISPTNFCLFDAGHETPRHSQFRSHHRRQGSGVSRLHEPAFGTP